MRKKAILFLFSEMQKGREKEQKLIVQKSDADGPRTSRSSILHLDIERELEQTRTYTTRCQAILSCLKGRAPLETVGVGSIVSLLIGEETGTYIVVANGGGAVGDYQVTSQLSPIGGAISGKAVGDELEVETPAGTLLVEILELA